MGNVKTHQLWTPAEDEVILRLQLEGHSAAEIGRTLGKTRSAIIGRLHRLRQKGLGLPKQTPRARTAPPPPRKPSAPRLIRSAGERVEKSEERRAKAANVGPGVHLAHPASREPWRVPKAEAFKPLPGTEPVPLIGRPAFTCAWVVGGEGAEALCCGQRASSGSYCPSHRALAYLPTAKLNPRDLRRYAA